MTIKLKEGIFRDFGAITLRSEFRRRLVYLSGRAVVSSLLSTPMSNRRLLSLFGLVGLTVAVYASPLSTHSIPSRSNSNQVSLAPLLESASPIENSYIVVLKDDVSPAAFNAHTNFVQNTHAQAQVTEDALQDVDHGLKHIYDSHIKGYAGSFSQSTVDKIRARPEVDYVELDQVVHTMNATTQKSAPWVRIAVFSRSATNFSWFRVLLVFPTGRGFLLALSLRTSMMTRVAKVSTFT